MSRKIITTFVMLAVIASSISVAAIPQQADAASTAATAATTFTGCFANGVLTSIAQSLVDQGVQQFANAVSGLTSGILKNFLGGVLAGLGPVPVSDGDTFAAFTNQNVRDAILERCTALAIMTTITNNTLAIVRSGGRDGGATYVTNWTNFETQAAYRGENIFRAELSTSSLCPYFSNSVKQSYGVNPNQKTNLTGQNTRVDSLQPFSLQTNCTLPSNFNMTNYQNNFSANGGWDTYAAMLQPQNNAMGVAFMSQDEIQKQRTLQQSADINQVLSNNGYTGVSGSGAGNSCQIMGPNGQCVVYKDIKTPGSYISQNLGATVGAQFSWLTSAQGLNTIISDTTGVMLSRLLNLGNTNEPKPVLANDNGGTVTPGTTTSSTTTTTTPPAGTSAACVASCVSTCTAAGTSSATCNSTCPSICSGGGGSPDTNTNPAF